MNKDLSLAIIILTYNEEIHIERCINNVKQIASEIFIIDSFSTDKTVEIAESLGAVVLQNKWPNNHASQLNWGLENAPFTCDWIFRIDADELITEELAEEIRRDLPLLAEDTTGVILPRYIFFMGKRIKRGTGIQKILRLFRREKAICENKMMDEHMVLLDGQSVEFSHFMVDENLNNLTWWTTKHNGYSTREMIDLISQEFDLTDDDNSENELTEHAKKKRKLKSIYTQMPLFWRAGGYFFYRYILKGGFLEGKEGFLWHFLQGFWYRLFVDAKIYEIKKACGNDKNKIREYILFHYQIKL
ncbi:MAG: glycosyltransferase family 2 protein [Flavobacteriales bacterium]|nr:glycosyltransferase family 2 protein [Flavobacteriales bacterium]